MAEDRGKVFSIMVQLNYFKQVQFIIYIRNTIVVPDIVFFLPVRGRIFIFQEIIIGSMILQKCKGNSPDIVSVDSVLK